jgi:hypothetical protein
MNGFSLLLAVASLGVTYSWRTGLDQQQEYVLQIEPEIVATLLSGVAGQNQPEEIFSDVPLEAGTPQRICIAILPKDTPATRRTPAGEEQFRQLIVSAGRVASRDPALVTPDGSPTILWPGRAGSAPEQTYGIATGWQPDAEGKQQYIVQVDPAVLTTLSVGDELYVPVEAAAGRISRFIVKAGKERLPRATQLSQVSLTPTPPPGVSPAPNRFGEGAERRSNWTNTPAGESRSPARFGSGFTDVSPGNPPVAPYQPPPGTVLSPRGAVYETPAGGYAESLAPRTGQAAYPPTNDPAAARAYEMSRGPVYPEMATNPAYATLPPTQPVQYGGQRTFSPTYPEARTAALPPVIPQTTAPGVPVATMPVAVQPNQDKPWGPLLFVTFALFFSIGGNLYLAYTALEFHGRYRSAIERLRSAARSS